MSTVTIPDDLELFVRQQVESGSYASAADVVADALRVLAAEVELSEQDRLDALRQALKPGLEDITSGRLSDRTVADFMRDAKSPRR
jgi:putative addiction module CopG family antidote